MAQWLNGSIFPFQSLENEREELLFEHLDTETDGRERQGDSAAELHGIFLRREEPGAAGRFARRVNPSQVSRPIPMMISKNDRLFRGEIQVRERGREGFRVGHPADGDEPPIRERGSSK